MPASAYAFEPCAETGPTPVDYITILHAFARCSQNVTLDSTLEYTYYGRRRSYPGLAIPGNALGPDPDPKVDDLTHPQSQACWPSAKAVRLSLKAVQGRLRLRSVAIIV